MPSPTPVPQHLPRPTSTRAAAARGPASLTADEEVAFAARFPVHVDIDTGKRFHKLVACGPDGRRTKALRVDVSRKT